MMFGCCKTCMGCHEAGTGGCHVSRWCDIVTWHRMLPRTPWWYMAIVKWEEIILIAVSSSPHTRHTQPRDTRDSQRMGSWTWRQDVLLSSKLIWTCHLCLGPSNIICYMTSNTRTLSTHYSSHVPGFSVVELSLSWALGWWGGRCHSSPITIWYARHSLQCLCLPIFAELVIRSDY